MENSMKHTVILLSLILAVAMLLPACAPVSTPAAAPQAAATTKVPAQPTALNATAQPPGPQQIQVTEADQGKDFILNPGDSLVIVLDSNPSTGYAWEMKPVIYPVLSLDDKPGFIADNDKLGAPGKTTFTVNAVASGSQVLTLLYQRSFEKDTQPLKTFTINVTVSRSASVTPVQPASNSKSSSELANPASKYCTDKGFTNELRTAADGSQYGVCMFPDGSECDEWAYSRGECKAGQYFVAPTPVLGQGK
jgi:predicted secreted protein